LNIFTERGTFGHTSQFKKDSISPKFSNLKIDKNVPMPKSFKRMRIMDHIKLLEIGDSVIISKDYINNVRQAINQYRKRSNECDFSYISRREGNDYRIWKTAK